MDIMKPGHLRWKEFYKRLEGEEGCNFRKEKGPPDEDGSFNVIWDCAGGTDKSKARAILETMEGIDVEASLTYFESKGGYCDCEILMNVAS